MITFFILLLGISQNHAASLIHNSPGSLDEEGVCQCSVVLPDTTFPADRFEMLQISNYNLTITVEEQISKIHDYESTLSIYTERLVNLTRRVEVMENGGLSYTELDFKQLQLEMKEIEAEIQQLKTSMNGTNVLEALHMQISDLSSTVSQLEVYDKNNVMVIRREMAVLKKQLEDWVKNEAKPTDSGIYGQGYIMNISKPTVVQLNYQGSNNKDGAWGRDSLAGADQNVLWVAPVSTDGRSMNNMHMYNTFDDLMIYKHSTESNMYYGNYGQGSGLVMYNKTMYGNCYNSENVCKYNPQLNNMELVVNLPNAVYNNRFSYSSSLYQDIDMAADEEGLWAIYSTEAKSGNMIISKIDPMTPALLQTWTTGLYKPSATNAFMAFGALYATRALSTKKEEIFYMYDTKTETEKWLHVPMEKPMENVKSLSYNPNDHMLYMYNDGYLVNFDVTFSNFT